MFLTYIIYIYILLLLKLIIQHNFTQFKKFFLFKYLYKYFEKDWTAANMPIYFFLILSQLLMYSLINITWLSHDILW